MLAPWTDVRAIRAARWVAAATFGTGTFHLALRDVSLLRASQIEV